MALVDPLLAQLPTAEGEWRIGHFQRQLPEGYLESLETGENLIGNPYLKIYYDKLLVVVSGEIFKIDRFVEIWRINTGYYDDLVHNYVEESR